MIDAFYSDPHFGHANIIKYSSRPFATSEEMDQELVSRYNAKVSSNMTVMWTGDGFFCPIEKIKEIMSSLNGRKMLVIGNHDRNPDVMLECGFDIVVEQCVLQVAGSTLRACHFPYFDSHPSDKRFSHKRPPIVRGEMLVHGHSHSKEKFMTGAKTGKNWVQIHVGVDAWNYEPVSVAEIQNLINDNDLKSFLPRR